MFDANARWLNEPPAWEQRGDGLLVRTAAQTDFWQGTFYGFHRDSGHFLHQPVRGDFTATVTLRARYEALYDQAGLMLRLDDTRWLKTGIEYTDGETHFSVVVTNGWSDWSVLPLPSARETVTLRLTRHGEAIRVQYRDGEGRWQMARLAYFPAPETLDVGVMCCSPEREGFEVTFSGFSVGAPIARALHE